MALGAIAVFRLYYYIVPLFLAGAMFAANEVVVRRRALVSGAKPGAPTDQAKPGQPRWSEPDFAVAASTGTVALCGAMLLSIGVLDTHPDYSWIDPDFASFAASAGQYVPSLIGTALMVLAIGLSQRVTLAWGATIMALLAGAAVTALQGEPDLVPAILVFAALSVAPFRDAYYRHARLLSNPLRASTLLPLFALLGSVMWLASFEPKVRNLAQSSWWAVVLSRNAPAPIRAAVALAVVLALAALWGIMRPGRVRALPWNGEGRLRYAAFGALPPAMADGLVLGEASAPASRSAASVACCSASATQPAQRTTASPPSGACATSHCRRAGTPRSGASAPSCSRSTATWASPPSHSAPTGCPCRTAKQVRSPAAAISAASPNAT